ncbi:hypothetical protein DPMN_000034 [Dreissena polymorpha]|uniref:Uncharacterized protein n=1 Tax=Dreissena polymorpha TaxID=45954 RepID=A0A9D4MG13_DREPO|nr:hypothetical protein DPMN_000034 [Dreissena polymorpha]
MDRIGIREVLHQIEVNRCRNEEIIVKDNFGWGGLLWAEHPRIDRLVIRDWALPMWAGRPRVGYGAMHIKGNFGWAWSMWAGRTRIDRIVIREVQYQFEVNRCRNEEIIVNGNFGWEWPMWAGCPRIDRIVIREVQNEEIIVKGNFGGRGLCGRGAAGLVMGPCIVEFDLIVIREAQYQFEVNRCKNEEFNQQVARMDGRTDAHQYNIPTFSPKNVGIKMKALMGSP